MKQHLMVRRRSKYLTRLKFFGIALVLIVLFLCSFNFGRFEIPIDKVLKIILSRAIPMAKTWDTSQETVVLFIRLPRLIAAVLVGGALALAGAAYQAVFKNPLVSPDILGASSGASLGAAIAIFSGFGSVWVQILAFVCSLVAIFLTYNIGGRIKKEPTLALILAGIFISSLCNAVVSMIKFMADPNDKLPTLTYWLMGSLGSIEISQVVWIMIPMLIGAVPLLLLRWRLNVMSMGEDESKALGIETKRLRIIVILNSTILTAASISIGGLIGWVGLVIPHLARRLVGPNNKVMLPASVLMGGAFLLLVDNFARTLTAKEVPLGVLTAIVGAPFFITLMMYNKE